MPVRKVALSLLALTWALTAVLVFTQTSAAKKTVDASKLEPPPTVVEPERPTWDGCKVLVEQAEAVATMRSNGIPKTTVLLNADAQLTHDRASLKVRSWYAYMVETIYRESGTPVERVLAFLTGCVSLDA